nr:RNA-binding protein 28 [Megalopta genalis]XP_033343103.1 RNA-binding protein 28 [Megalopta genalis]XP_033343104.1 RNA-binding protein 28 [Megalopta genalis]XP_033343105.1 RNA-binding protein 28 [Megalopta genalis]
MRNTKYTNKGDKKKLSWIYRKKIKTQKASRSVQSSSDNANDNKKPRIIIRNLSFKATTEDIKTLYEPFGQIEEINFPKRADGSPVGCCFVQFKQLKDASKAIFNTNKKEFLGRVINSSWAISKSKYCEKLKKDAAENVDEAVNQDEEDNQNNEVNVRKEFNLGEDFDLGEDDQEAEEDYQDEEGDQEAEEVKQEELKPIKKEKDLSKKEETVQIRNERRKLAKEKSRKRRARIVIRNLSFEATEKHLRKYFSQYGAIEDVNILKRNDGKNVGCAFLQFELVQSAAKAIHYANLQPLLNRLMVVDWAVPKNKFAINDNNIDENQGKVEVEEGNGEKLKVEKDSHTKDTPAAETAEKSNSSEEVSSNREHVEASSESDQSDNDDEEVNTELENKDETIDEELPEDDKEDIKEIEKENDVEEQKRPRYESHDVSEGKTIFLKNVPFSVKNEQLKEFMQQFGPVYYALVCIDPLTEYSKGTAFVKFKNIEDAEKCLAAGTGLEIDDQIMEAQRAIDRNEIESKAKSKQLKYKDTRNLYLVKEGVIMAGSAAASGVSATDMAKRLQMEQWKSQILRNLHMFVSRSRLIIHNLPSTLDDAKLRKIAERYAPTGAIVREARVMRDLRNVDMKGVGKSKEHGFISFTRHEDALEALRNINNNPKIFNPKRRPIVSFSIENRVMLNARQKRTEKSRENNPTWPGNKAKRKGEETNEGPLLKKSKFGNSSKIENNEPRKKPFVGMVAKPGENKMRSKFKLKNQAAVHHQSVKKEKKLKKSSQKLKEKRRNRRENKNEVKSKQKMKVKAADMNLDRLVNNYKNKLKSIELKKSKWYES